ncbi:MAG TPA: hypothetical protein VHL80_00145 [Polyangia bacterium]|nr:hypothetical protein [Polyangia bacterium]
MKARIRSEAPIANDNGKVASVVPLASRRTRAVRRRSTRREWAPAILATFFTGS